MKKLLLLLLLAAGLNAFAQKQPLVDVKDAERIENFLASDEMRGRKAGSPEIDRAADFIASEFKKSGLEPFLGNSYLQKFTMVRAKQGLLKAEMNDKDIDPAEVIVITTKPEIKVNEKSGYEFDSISARENFGTKARSLVRSGKNLIVWVDTSFSKNFGRIASLKSQLFSMENNVVFVLGKREAKTFTIKAEHEITSSAFSNVAAVLPGKSRKNEYVIFSAHYDHIGIGKPLNGDSIYNGANDDAAGTTAVILLAKHFKNLGNQERTIVFVAFTAEEIGGFGSQYFSGELDPASVAAMFNIEMIGTESKWGKNSAYITGFEMTDMGQILQKNLEGTDFRFHPDPYPQQRLFYRSDNATLARLGVPAHTISTAKMEEEPHYHKASDEVSTLDISNMAAIIEAIAKSSASIVSGKDTPSRVKAGSMR